MDVTIITQYELQHDIKRIMREVAEGREFVISVDGTAVARLVAEPLAPRSRTFVPRSKAEGVIDRARTAFSGITMQDIRDVVDDEPQCP